MVSQGHPPKTNQQLEAVESVMFCMFLWVSFPQKDHMLRRKMLGDAFVTDRQAQMHKRLSLVTRTGFLTTFNFIFGCCGAGMCREVALRHIAEVVRCTQY